MEKIPEIKKAIDLQSSLYHLLDVEPFYGNLLQTIDMYYNHAVPTAAITFDTKTESFKVLLNPNFFCSMPLKQRVAVLKHEILHFTNKHLFRLPFINATPEERILYNIAGDMSINQFIQHLPEKCIDYKNFTTDDGKPFPEKLSMEDYYLLLKDNPKSTQKTMGEGKGQTLDEHAWEQLPEEDKQKILEEAKKLIKRTIDKTQFSHSNVPKEIQDLIQEIEGLCNNLNYKELLRKTIKRTVSFSERDRTWKRPNKRYGDITPGTKLGSLPLLSFYIDTSGSISITEMNEFLNIMNQFLKVGVRNCKIGFWHTSLYKKRKHKKGQPINQEEIQSGGTDVEGVLMDIAKTRPDLSIVLTDGYYDSCNVKPSGEVIWIISKGGNQNHPLKHIGKTILLDYLK